MNGDPTDLEYLQSRADAISSITPKGMRIRKMVREYEAKQRARQEELRALFCDIVDAIEKS